MNFVWCDYNPETMGYIENWLDESAVNSTGLDEGFRNFYEYWANEDGFVVGENYWCKVIFENDEPDIPEVNNSRRTFIFSTCSSVGGASDIFILSGTAIGYRVSGKICRKDDDRLTPNDTRYLISQIFFLVLHQY